MLLSSLLGGSAFAQTATETTAQPQEAPASQPLSLLKGPYLQALQPDGVTICLEPSQEAGGRIVVRDADGKTVVERSFEGAPGQVTKVGIDGLKAGTTYAYAVHLEGGAAPVGTGTIKTFPPVGHLPVEFAATGDSRTHPAIFHEVSEAIRKLGLPMVIHTGDFVSTGRVVRLWDGQFFQPAREMLASVALYPAIGNHEMSGAGPDPYVVLNRFFVLPDQKSWYSFDYGGVHFTVLDSCSRDTLETEQYEWAEKDLRATKATWKIAVFHTPWFCAGNHESDVEMRRIFGPLFAKAGVDLSFVGHDHNYQKTKPIVHAFEPRSAKPYWQIVTGGGGAPLYNRPRPEVFLDKFENVNHYMKVTAEKDRLLAVAYNMDGSELDRLEIRKDKPVEGAVTFEQILVERALRDCLARHPFVLRPGESAASLSGIWTNTFPVAVDLRFVLGDDKRFELDADSGKIRAKPRASTSQPSITDIRLKLQLLVPRESLRDMPTALNVSYEAPQVGSGKMSNIRVPVVVVKTLQPSAAGEIAVDGKLEEPAWSQAALLTGFRETRKQDPESGEFATTIQAAVDAQHLYLALTCRLPEDFRDRDSSDIAKADNVRIDLAADAGSTLTLIATPQGKTQLQPQDSSAKVAVVRGKTGWMLEVAVPLASLGQADEIRFNVQRQTSGKTYALMPLFGGGFDCDTAALIPLKAATSQPATTVAR
jgi:3',5'-cyclic AMP phosphodiesterase CpdA